MVVVFCQTDLQDPNGQRDTDGTVPGCQGRLLSKENHCFCRRREHRFLRKREKKEPKKGKINLARNHNRMWPWFGSMISLRGVVGKTSCPSPNRTLLMAIQQSCGLLCLATSDLGTGSNPRWPNPSTSDLWLTLANHSFSEAKSENHGYNWLHYLYDGYILLLWPVFLDTRRVSAHVDCPSTGNTSLWWKSWGSNRQMLNSVSNHRPKQMFSGC